MENDANKKWLVMVYMAADTGDSFYQAAMEDIAEMMEAEFNPNQVRVMVHADAPSPWPKKCWEIKRPSESWACNHNSLLDFIGDCVKKYPANNYLLVLWGHGEGIDWKEKVIKGSGANSGIIRAGKRFAPGSQGALEVVELGDVLGKLAEELKGKGYAKTFKKENTIVGFDACLMGMAEVYCQISDYVGWVVSPSDEIPNTGWAYKDILNELGISPGKEPPGLAKVIVNRCTESYSGKTSKSDVSFSACTLELSGEFIEAVKLLTTKLKTALGNDVTKVACLNAIRKAREFAEDFKEKAYIDLNAFCKELKRQVEKTELPELADLGYRANDVVTTLDGFVLLEGFSDEYPWKYKEDSRAVSICFPETADLEGSVPGIEIALESYKKLKFSQTRWLEFLKQYWAQPTVE